MIKEGTSSCPCVSSFFEAMEWFLEEGVLESDMHYHGEIELVFSRSGDVHDISNVLADRRVRLWNVGIRYDTNMGDNRWGVRAGNYMYWFECA